MASSPPTDPEPITPTLATAISAARSIGTIVGGIGAVWGFVRTDDLSGLYQWAHGSTAAATGSALLFVLCFGWGLWRKYHDRQVVSAAKVVGVTRKNAGVVVSSQAPPAPPSEIEQLAAFVAQLKVSGASPTLVAHAAGTLAAVASNAIPPGAVPATPNS